MPNWVRRDLIVLVVVLAVRIPHSHIGQSYVQRTHTRPTLLQRTRNNSLVWSEDCKKAFEDLKNAFTTAPVLAH